MAEESDLDRISPDAAKVRLVLDDGTIYPTLELRNASGSLVDFNDNWMDHPKAAQIQAEGLAPAQAAEQLATLLRRTIEEDRDVVPVSEEWQFVEGYLQLEGRACWLMGECLAADAPATAPSGRE